MKLFLRMLKIGGCLYGGGAAASVLFVIGVLVVFGPNDFAPQLQFLQRWFPLVWFFGAAVGGVVVFRSDSHASQLNRTYTR